MARTPSLPIVLAALLLCLPAAPPEAQAQTTGLAPDSATFPGLRWRYVGPAIAGGRITDLEVVPSDHDRIYVGSASGGVWETRNGGTTWAPVFDGSTNLSVGDIALAPSDPLEVWVGTGEANNRNSSPVGAGIYHSTDGGKTWAFRGLEETRHIGRVLVHPTDPDVVWVAALGHLFGPNEERGVYKSTDAGRTWRKVLYLDENTGVVDMALHPSNPEVLLASAYQRRRRNHGFVGGGPGSGIYRSTDGGESWTEVTGGLPEGDKGRIGFETRTAEPNAVWAMVEADGGGVFRSDDFGRSWTRLNELNPRPMYYSKIRVDPSDGDRLYVLATRMHRSEDGGRTFEEMPMERYYNTGVHVDHHDLWIDPEDSDHMLLGNDGGLYWSRDRGAHWSFVPLLPIQQLYDVGIDMAEPYNVYGGLQDNNSYRGPSETRRHQGILNRDWQVIDYGDGMYTAPDPSDPDVVYVDSQGGGIVRVDLRTGDRKDLAPLPHDTTEEYRFDWTSPIVVSPHDPATIYLGGNRLFISRDRGISWSRTEDLTRAVPHDSIPIMGILPDSTTLSRNDGVSGYGEITTVAESSLVPGLLWVGTDDGKVQVSRDAGESWTDVSEALNRHVPRPMHVSRIDPSHHVEGRAYVSLDGHWDDDYEPWLFVTEDHGASWRPLTDGLGSRTVNAVREHPDNPELLFVAAEDGVWASLDRGATWARPGRGLPRVPVDDIEIHPRENDLVAGTHGRGIWILDDLAPLSGMTDEVAGAPAHLFPVGDAVIFQFRNDVPSMGQGVFQAENPPFGAVLDYRLREDAGGPVTLRIRDDRDRVVRTLEGSGGSGVHRVVWDLRYDPVPQDTAAFDVPGLDAGPEGPLVLPGAYTAELEANGVRSTRSFRLAPDPRMPIAMEERVARHDFTLELYELQKRGYRAGVRAKALTDGADRAMDALREAAEAEGGPDQATVARADSLVGVLAEARSETDARNSDLRGWWRGLLGEFKGGPSVIGTLTGPTESQRLRLGRMQEAFSAMEAEVDRAVREVLPELNALLEGAGVEPVEAPEGPPVV